MGGRNIDQLFLHVSQDLRERLESNDEYEVLKSSGLLRQLLLDNTPLLHQANRKYKLRIEFAISDFTPPPSDQSLLFWSVEDGLDPSARLPAWGIRKANLDGFLRTVVLRSNGTDFTIKDIILFEANVMGGIHSGSPSSDKERELMKVGALFVGGLPASLRQLGAITRVVLSAIMPLEKAIKTARF